MKIPPINEEQRKETRVDKKKEKAYSKPAIEIIEIEETRIALANATI